MIQCVAEGLPESGACRLDPLCECPQAMRGFAGAAAYLVDARRMFGGPVCLLSPARAWWAAKR